MIDSTKIRDGQAKLAAWQAKPEEAKFADSLTVSRADRSIDPAVLNAALRADPAALPQLKGVDLGPQGYAIVKVERVLPREALSEDQTRQAREQYSQWWATAEGQAYYQALAQRLKVEIKVSKPSPASVARS